MSIEDNDTILDHQTLRDNADHNLPPRPLELNDITMKFQLEKGDKVQRDCNCDSQYMLSVMEEVGESIRQRRWTRHERSD